MSLVPSTRHARAGRSSARAAEGTSCTTAVHICYGYGINANIGWKSTLGHEWRQYKLGFPALAKCAICQVSLECANTHVPMYLIRLLNGEDALVSVIDVASDVAETLELVADTIGRGLQFVARERIDACTNCGMAPMDRNIALAKLAALGAGAQIAHERHD